MWRLRPNDGGAQNVWSLGGNSSPISCLCFDDHELTLVSGSVGGSVRLYDLNEGRCTRAMAGHRNEVTCVDAHPFGDFLASGGADAAVRVWDARKKACIQTYKGHGGEVEDVKFSPDGRWVASASRGDGFVRVWDVRKLGKGAVCEFGGVEPHGLTANVAWAANGAVLCAPAAPATRGGRGSLEFLGVGGISRLGVAE